MIGLRKFWRDFNLNYQANRDAFYENEARYNADYSAHEIRQFPARFWVLFRWIGYGWGVCLWWSVLVVICAKFCGLRLFKPTSQDLLGWTGFCFLMVFLITSSIVMFIANLKFRVYGIRPIFMETVTRLFFALILSLFLGAVIGFFISRSL